MLTLFFIAGSSEVNVIQKVYDLLKLLSIDGASLCRESGWFEGAGRSEDL